jgi:hypothetical protein
MAAKGTQNGKPQWMTLEEIESVCEALSADDLIEGTASKGTSSGGLLMVKVAFNRAAERSGHGEDATTRVRASDFQHLAKLIAGVVNVDNPLSEGTGDLLASAASGE